MLLDEELIMQTNWSLILNALLLIGVIITISRMLRARRNQFHPTVQQPSIGPQINNLVDDVIAVRKVACAQSDEAQVTPCAARPVIEPKVSAVETTPALENTSLMLFLLAKENRQLAGYELLQTLLTSGLRFGEGNLFHRHQSPNGQGPILCSLAAATNSGIFDMQHIGAFSVRGLCLFMHVSGNQTIDDERFSIMLETAKALSDGLDTHLLDDVQQPLNESSIQRYRLRIRTAQ